MAEEGLQLFVASLVAEIMGCMFLFNRSTQGQTVAVRMHSGASGVCCLCRFRSAF